MIIRNNANILLNKKNHKKQKHKKHFYNLYKNPFIDLTDDEEETSRIKNKERRDNLLNNKLFTCKVIPIYQEDFYNMFSREIIFHKYKIFNQELKGFYSDKRMKTLFENLFKNYNNMFTKKIINRNRTFSDIRNKNRMNTMPLLSNQNRKKNNDYYNPSSINRFKKYSSLDKVLNSLKNQVLIQRKKFNNNMYMANLKKYDSENEKNTNLNISYIQDNIIDSNSNKNNNNNNLIQDLSLKSLKDGEKYNLLNIKRKKSINFRLFENLKIYKKINKLKIIKEINKNKITKNNKHLIHKDELSKINKNLSLNNNNKGSNNSLFKYHLKNKNNSLNQINEHIINRNNSFDFEIKKIENKNINELLINKYSQNFLKKLKSIEKNKLNKPNSLNDINKNYSIEINKNK